MHWVRKHGVVAILLLLAVAPAGAQDVPPLEQPIQHQPEGDAAIKQLKSPFCPGLMLEICSHPDSKILRDTIQAMAQAGASADSLVNWMLGIYGDEYLAVPRARGSGLWAWLTPPLALIGGLVLVMIVLKHFRERREETPPSRPPLSEEDESVLASALEDLKASEEVPF